MGRRVLITGASVAGNTLAWWMSRYGFDVTVVERHPEFRDGGQNIDVRGVGRDVLSKMGLEELVRRSGTGETGIQFVDDDNQTVAEFGVDEVGASGPTAELEILRGDLARILMFAGGPCRIPVRRYDQQDRGVQDYCLRHLQKWRSSNI